MVEPAGVKPAFPGCKPSVLSLDDGPVKAIPMLRFWSRRWDLNPRPAVYKTAALASELRRLRWSGWRESNPRSRGPKPGVLPLHHTQTLDEWGFSDDGLGVVVWQNGASGRNRSGKLWLVSILTRRCCRVQNSRARVPSILVGVGTEPGPLRSSWPCSWSLRRRHVSNASLAPRRCFGGVE